MVGYITLSRQLREHKFWCDKPYARGQAWVDLIFRANFADAKILFDGKFIELKRGQFITSVFDLSNTWGWSRHKVSDFLNMIESDSMIEQKRDNKKTLISILNYDVYNNIKNIKGHQKDIKRTSKGHQKDTDNKKQEESNNNSFTPEQLLSIEKFKKYLNTYTPRVNELTKPFTGEQILYIKNTYTYDVIKKTLEAMQNHKHLLTKYIDAYLTFCNWADKRVTDGIVAKIIEPPAYDKAAEDEKERQKQETSFRENEEYLAGLRKIK